MNSKLAWTSRLRLIPLAGTLCLTASLASAHGGQYIGPGDTVPPGAGSGGGAGGPGSGPRVPGSGPGSGPGVPGSGIPGLPGRGAGIGGGATTGGGAGDLGPDLTQWTFWWELNKAPYLNLKAAIHAPRPTTGSDGFFIGRGQKSNGRNSLAPTDVQIQNQIVPALLAALGNESNNDIVTGCLIALAKIGDERSETGESLFEGTIASFLKDSNQEISETAAVALGILANDASIAPLEHLLLDDAEGRALVGRGEVNFRTRAFAAYGLGQIGARTAQEERRQEIVRILVDAIASDDTKSRDLKVAAIISMGLVPLETIEPENDAAEGQANSPFQSRIGQLDYLLDYLADHSHKFLVRAHVPLSLARLIQDIPEVDSQGAITPDQKTRVTEVLLQILDKSSKEHVEVMQSAALALGLIGDADADALDQRIRKTLSAIPKLHSNGQLRNFSLIAEAKVGSNPGSGKNRGAGAAEVSRAVLDQLGQGKSTLRPWAGLSAGVLGRRLIESNFGAAQVVDLSQALRTSLKKEKNPQRVSAYALGLGVLGDVEAQALLLEKLADVRNDETRGYISVALALSNAHAATGPIQRIITESKYRPVLLKQAAVALGLLGDKNLVLDLTDMLRKANSLATQAAICSALGLIGDKSSVTPLVEMLADESLTGAARGFAAVALGIVADKEPLPWNSKIAMDLNYRASTSTLTDTASGTGILDIL